jgi:hypothetical protein
VAKYFVIEPEVAGSLGPDTVMESGLHPPKVTELHYELSGWLGDDILESFPCFVVTDRARQVLEKQELSGFEFWPVKISTTETFRELYPTRELPTFYWLRVVGRAGEEDFGLAEDHRLVVSERALDRLRMCKIENCDIEKFV